MKAKLASFQHVAQRQQDLGHELRFGAVEVVDDDDDAAVLAVLLEVFAQAPQVVLGWFEQCLRREGIDIADECHDGGRAGEKRDDRGKILAGSANKLRQSRFGSLSAQVAEQAFPPARDPRP